MGVVFALGNPVMYLVKRLNGKAIYLSLEFSANTNSIPRNLGDRS